MAAAPEGGEPAPWLVPHLTSDDPAVRVASTLVEVRLRVPGAIGLVLRLMDELPEDAATLRLTPLSAPGTVVPAAAEPVARRIAARPGAEWVDALRHLPMLAADCVDDLVRLPPTSTGMLAALGPSAGHTAARALHVRAGAGDLTAALAPARVTAEAEPAVDVVRALPDAVARRTAVRVAAELGLRVAELLPLVEERLPAPGLESRAGAAAAVWRVTGRTHDTAP
ncbi:hypothetical protein ABZ349_10065 [Streptomyces niveus]|uniref:hypothetical protein n=1 Tax=Streptomyces niveus TaxID=193462 RepID=UPI0033CC225A